tara:strand:- start:1726 stop:1905 length:180 start_codon:yes stop_codon:yes gene_type:complete
MKRLLMVICFCLFSNYALAGGMPGEEAVIEKEQISEVVVVEETNNSFKKFIFLLLLCVI